MIERKNKAFHPTFYHGTTKRPCHERPITSSCSTAAHIIYPLTIMYVETEQCAVYAGCFSQENSIRTSKNTMFSYHRGVETVTCFLIWNDSNNCARNLWCRLVDGIISS